MRGRHSRWSRCCTTRSAWSRVHDHGARLHRRPDAAGRAAPGPAPRPVGGGQNRAGHHRRRPGHRRGHSRAGRQAGRGGRPGSSGRRLPHRPGGGAWPDVTAAAVNEAFAAAASGPLAGIVRYSTDPSSPATSSATPPRACSTPGSPRRPAGWSRCSAGTTTSGDTPAGWPTWPPSSAGGCKPHITSGAAHGAAPLACRGSGALDPAAGDPVRDDADVHVAITARPWP